MHSNKTIAIFLPVNYSSRFNLNCWGLDHIFWKNWSHFCTPACKCEIKYTILLFIDFLNQTGNEILWSEDNKCPESISATTLRSRIQDPSQVPSMARIISWSVWVCWCCKPPLLGNSERFLNGIWIQVDLFRLPGPNLTLRSVLSSIASLKANIQCVSACVWIFS